MSRKESSLPVAMAIELPEVQGGFGTLEDVRNFPELEEVRPTQGVIKVNIVLDNFDAKILAKHRQMNFSDAYDTTSSPRGGCLIINNKTFDKLAERTGTDIDCTNLEALFTKLGFSVSVLRDRTAAQMKSDVQDYILDKNHANHSSCVLVILSHGFNGKIVGTDGRYIDERSDILEHFNDPTCKLDGKPKLVVIQACRSELEKKTNHSQTSFESSDGHEDEQYVDMVDRMRRLNYADAAAVNTLPQDFADILIAHSTLPGYVSWRHKGQGSWFIQAIVQTFSVNFKDEHVADMLVMVNRMVGDVFGQNRNTQMPSPVNHMRKKFYFFPIGNRE